ncbi:flagellar protein [Rhizobiales bacterium]|uniref:flagellin N-terminal helical domain-containing protein n=1 Tax=Hongsoonwoonella zoysiae TaxID=2821844 RepID=UPI0015607188|nr:flagellin [Hongsoonwoonella zoysiae]NRG18005.1 flagellar protein [Hongsoonwoonella zoysiae]
MSDITLSAGVRQNLLSLQNTAELLGETQNRLATGKKVNSALDNPTNFFTSQGLQSRANDLTNLLDGIGNAIQTLEAADNGIKAITKLVESAQSTVRQAQQANTDAAAVTNIQGTSNIDTSLSSGNTTRERALNQSLNNIGFTDGDTIVLTSTDENGTDSTVTFTVGAANDGAQVQDLIDKINTSGIAKADVTSDGRLDITANGAASLDLTISSNDAAAGATGDVGQNTAGGAFAGLGFGANASVDLSTPADADFNDPGETEVTFTQGTGGTGGNFTDTLQIVSTATASDADNADLAEQFNDILQQIDELAADASFNGVNLINSGDSELTVAFNERRDAGRSELTIQGQDLTSFGLSLTDATNLSDQEAEDKLNQLADALTSLRSAGSQFGSQLTTVNIREDFTKDLVNTLQIGADNLVLADTNEEGANLLALQTRQQLSTTALSLSSQADQAVLRLF